MIIVTADSIPGKNIITTIGHVKGSSARARHAVADVFASLKNIVGGEVSEYSRLLQQTRDQAIERMVKEAEDNAESDKAKKESVEAARYAKSANTMTFQLQSLINEK